MERMFSFTINAFVYACLTVLWVPAAVLHLISDLDGIWMEGKTLRIIGLGITCLLGIATGCLVSGYEMLLYMSMMAHCIGCGLYLGLMTYKLGPPYKHHT